MNFHSAEDFLLTNACLNRAKSTAVQRNPPCNSAELPANIADGANRGLQIFPVSQTSRYAASSLIKARIGDSTSDLARLAELAAEDPACWALATGPDAGVFAVEMEGELGVNAFNGLIALDIINLQDEVSDWQTLSAADGWHTFAIYTYPSGMTLRRNSKHPEPGLTIHGDGSYVLLTPDFVFLDPNVLIAPGPQLLLDLAFEKVSNEVTDPPVRQIGPRRAESRFLPNSANPGAGSQIWGVVRNGSTARSNVGWRGKVRISRRS
ncbi:MAG: bifunctional DNA primase/polymerase [Terracidiphilus sp.]|jgi:hypothetical protein